MPFEQLNDWELFDADLGTDLAAEVQLSFIPDFSNWKDQGSYKKAFDRRLKDMKAGARGFNTPSSGIAIEHQKATQSLVQSR